MMDDSEWVAASWIEDRVDAGTLRYAKSEFFEWLEKHDAEVQATALEDAAAEWQRGAWSNDLPSKGASRMQAVLRMSQRTTDWLRESASKIRREAL